MALAVRVRGHAVCQPALPPCDHQTAVVRGGVADVARAHIVGMENVAAGGSRYLCCAPAMLWADVAALLKVGGLMAFSTCSLNPCENESVVAEL